MKVRAGKVVPKKMWNDTKANEDYHVYMARKRLAKVRKGTRWLLANAATTTKYLLIGEPEK